mmetsp:Transcript_7741/g.22936  ORF Transcript_7741/g.22936 Transcript_7741/m.22936 type:complete len:324 (-) Transcript_7741:425-1396(-)
MHPPQLPEHRKGLPELLGVVDAVAVLDVDVQHVEVREADEGLAERLQLGELRAPGEVQGELLEVQLAEASTQILEGRSLAAGNADMKLLQVLEAHHPLRSDAALRAHRLEAVAEVDVHLAEIREPRLEAGGGHHQRLGVPQERLHEGVDGAVHHRLPAQLLHDLQEHDLVARVAHLALREGPPWVLPLEAPLRVGVQRPGQHEAHAAPAEGVGQLPGWPQPGEDGQLRVQDHQETVHVPQQVAEVRPLVVGVLAAGLLRPAGTQDVLPPVADRALRGGELLGRPRDGRVVRPAHAVPADAGVLVDPEDADPVGSLLRPLVEPL